MQRFGFKIVDQSRSEIEPLLDRATRDGRPIEVGLYFGDREARRLLLERLPGSGLPVAVHVDHRRLSLFDLRQRESELCEQLDFAARLGADSVIDHVSMEPLSKRPAHREALVERIGLGLDVALRRSGAAGRAGSGSTSRTSSKSRTSSASSSETSRPPASPASVPASISDTRRSGPPRRSRSGSICWRTGRSRATGFISICMRTGGWSTSTSPSSPPTGSGSRGRTATRTGSTTTRPSPRSASGFQRHPRSSRCRPARPSGTWTMCSGASPRGARTPWRPEGLGVSLSR